MRGKKLLFLMAAAISLSPVSGFSAGNSGKEEIHVIEAEDMTGAGTGPLYGDDSSGAFGTPFYYRKESGCWAAVIKKGLKDTLSTEILCGGKQPYYLYIRVGARDSGSAFKLQAGDYTFDFKEEKNSASPYRWVSVEEPLKLSGKVPVRLIFSGEPAVVDCVVLRTKKEIPPDDCSPLGYPFHSPPKGVHAAFFPAFNFRMPLYICAGTAQQFLLAHSNLTENTVKDWTLKLTVPEWVELMDPSIGLRRREGEPGTLSEASHFSRPFAAPREMSGPVRDNGGKKEYTLKYNGCGLPPKTNAQREHNQTKYIYMTVFKAASGAHPADKITLETLTPDGARLTVEQKIICLPAPNVPLPTKRLAALHGPYIEYLSAAEQDALLESMGKFGASTLITGMPKTDEDYKRDIHLTEICGKNNIDLCFALHRSLPYCSYSNEMSDDYTKKYPRHKGVKSKSSKLACSIVEPEHLANDRSEYMTEQIAGVSGLMNRLGIKKIMIDFEQSHALEFSFSEASINAFRKAKNIPDSEKLDEDIILRKHRKEWIDFRCAQNFRIIKNFVGLIKEEIKNVKIILYSGYQKDLTKEKYGMDWKYMIPDVEFALGGDGIATPQHGRWIHDTFLAIKKAGLSSERLTFCEHSIDDWAGSERFSPPGEYGARAALAIGSGATGGLYSWYWGCMDGLTMTGFSQAVNILAKLEKENITNVSSEIFDLNSSGFIDSALMGGGGRTLLFICNVFSNNRVFSLKAVKEKLGDFKYKNFAPESSCEAIKSPDEITLDGGKYLVWEIVR